MTNYERIKAMDIDGLADFINRQGTHLASFDCQNCKSKFGGTGYACNEASCAPFVKKWLMEECEDD